MMVYLLDEVRKDIVGQEETAASETQAPGRGSLDEAQIDGPPELDVKQLFDSAPPACRHLSRIDPLVQSKPQHERFPDGRPPLQPLARLPGAPAGDDPLAVIARAGG